jgi:hypothetical protein
MSRKCDVEGCAGLVHAKGLCSRHYWEARKTGEVCQAPECGKPAWSRNLCRWHYEQARMAVGEPCGRSGCTRGQYARGLCLRHYHEAKEGGEFGPQCDSPDCVKGAVARGLCPTHYMRLRPAAGFTTRANRIQLTCRGVDNHYFKNGGHAFNCKRSWTGTQTLAKGLVSRREDGTFLCHPCWLWKLKLDKVEPSRQALLLAGEKLERPRSRKEVHELIADARRLSGQWGGNHAGRRAGRGRRATTYDWQRMKATTTVVACKCRVFHLLDKRDAKRGHRGAPPLPSCLEPSGSPSPETLATWFDWFVRSRLGGQSFDRSTWKGLAFVGSHLPEPEQVQPRYRNLVVTLLAVSEPNRRRPNAGPVRRQSARGSASDRPRPSAASRSRSSRAWA